MISSKLGMNIAINWYLIFYQPILADKEENNDALRAGGWNFWTGWRCPYFSYFVEI